MIRLGLVKPDRLISLHRLTRPDRDPGGRRRPRARRHGHARRHRTLGCRAGRLAAPRRGGAASRQPGDSHVGHHRRQPRVRGGRLGSGAGPPLSRRRGARGRPGGSRSVPVARFFRGFYEAALEPGEIVTAVRVPGAAGRRARRLRQVHVALGRGQAAGRRRGADRADAARALRRGAHRAGRRGAHADPRARSGERSTR